MIIPPRMSADWTDQQLMLAVREGDVGKLSVLFQRYHARLFEYFSRMDGRKALAEDLVQDVFFRILHYRTTFRDESPFVPWMYQIARNVRFQHFKKESALRELETSATAGIAFEASVASILERNEEEVALKCALLKLPEDKRELLVLVWYQEMKYGDIADLLGIQVGAVKVRVHRAVKELREIYLNETDRKTLCNVKKPETNSQTI
jgi:RNA polymerase sigma factor (sigma-70 family)